MTEHGHAADPAHRSPRICPRCTGRVHRIRRRLIDRLLSFFVPMQRYRCETAGCRWSGNLRKRRPTARR